MQSLRIAQPRGYIALISSIVISTVLLALTTTVLMVSFSGREHVLYDEFKRTTRGLAEGCANWALVNISADYFYTITTPVSVHLFDGHTCSIESVTFGAEANHQKMFTIRTKAQFRGAYSTLEVTAEASNPDSPPPSHAVDIRSWMEI